MSITATVENDTIKLPAGVHLPNGTTVKIEPVVETERQPSGKTFAERYAKYIGMVDDMPPDLPGHRPRGAAARRLARTRDGLKHD